MDEQTIRSIHSSVLLQETVRFLDPQPGELYVDATLGMGGHAEALLSAADCTVLGIDQDAEAIELAKARLHRFEGRFFAVQGNFIDIATSVGELGKGSPAGVVADLGVSSLQFDTAERGFSFR